MINMPKIKLRNAQTDPSKIISTVTISCGRYGDFTGRSFLHPTDYSKYSRFIGCEYAEQRAMIQLYKVMRKEALDKVKILTDFYKSIKDMRNFDYDNIIAIQLRKEIERTQKDADTLKMRIIDTENWIQDSIEARDKTFTKLQEKAKNK